MWKCTENFYISLSELRCYICDRMIKKKFARISYSVKKIEKKKYFTQKNIDQIKETRFYFMKKVKFFLKKAQ